VSSPMSMKFLEKGYFPLYVVVWISPSPFFSGEVIVNPEVHFPPRSCPVFFVPSSFPRKSESYFPLSPSFPPGLRGNCGRPFLFLSRCFLLEAALISFFLLDSRHVDLPSFS